VTLVTLELRVRAAAGVDGARWAFDDGLNAEGVTVRHVFARPGLHNVRVAAMPKGGQTCEADATIRVRPRWLQPEECPADVVIRQRELVLGYALDRLAIGDLAAVTVFADAAQERGWAIALGDALLARRSELKGGAAEALYRLALQYQHPEVRRYDVAEQAFRLVAGLPDAPPALAAQAALHYAGYLVHALGRPEEAAQRLAAVPSNQLSAYDLRLRDIYTGDVALALGQADKARAQYTAIGLVGAEPDVGYFVRRRARLEQATDSLAKRDYESVETIIRTIEWERPVERMATRTGFPLIEAFLGQKAYPFALGRCLLIQQARPPEEHEAQLLFYLVEIHQALGQKANAAAALHRLLKEHPLSEPAARAKERFRGLIQVSAG
jgi:tetratricopeptide (TPR) repeat protein